MLRKAICSALTNAPGCRNDPGVVAPVSCAGGGESTTPPPSVEAASGDPDTAESSWEDAASTPPLDPLLPDCPEDDPPPSSPAGAMNRVFASVEHAPMEMRRGAAPHKPILGSPAEIPRSSMGRALCGRCNACADSARREPP
jgi:hypothetical protein